MLIYPAALLAIEGDADRLFMQQLYEQHYRIMCAQAYKVVGDPGPVEDILSEACIALIGKLQILTRMERPVLRAYVVSTVRNTAINFVRRQSRLRRGALDDPESALQNLAGGEDVDAPLLLAEAVDRLKRAIARLPEGERAALQMKYFQDMTDEQIAQALGIRKDSVRKYLLRARRRALELMEGE